MRPLRGEHRHERASLVVGGLIAWAVMAAAWQPAPPPAPRELLRAVAQISDAEWTALERGEAVAKALDTDNREIAIAGGVRIATNRDRLIERYRDIEALERSALVLAAGRFRRPQQVADLAALPIEEYDLDLRECRPGDCKVRLGPDEIARFHRDVDWRAADWRERSRAVWRDTLTGYVAAYSRDGRKALPTFANKPEPLSVPSELSQLVDRFAFVNAYSPAFLAYLREFGSTLPEDASEVFYWTKEDFGVRPVMRLQHQVIHRTPDAILFATNQIYANHYLDASLTVTLAIDAEHANGKPGFYMVIVNRSRTRSLSGVVRSLVRSTVRDRSRDGLRKILQATKSALERS